MHEKIANLFHAVSQTYLTSIVFSKDKALNSLIEMKEFLEEKQKEKGNAFVHGIGKRKTQLQKWIEQLSEFIERQVSYSHSHAQSKECNSYSKTDPDATFMHMKEDHMRNSQLKPGYNIQIGVESEYIVGIGVYADRTDYGTVIPMLESMEQGIGIRYQKIIADSGYESEANYCWLESKEISPYIKPQTYEQWKKRSFKKDVSKRENMRYIEEKIKKEKEARSIAKNQLFCDASFLLW